MAEIKKLSELKSNEKNPRKIDKVALEKLKKSIEEFPDMLELRPIVVNKDGVVLGGNMRLRAMKELGIKECPVEVADKLTPEQEREFVIKDNVSGGEWDWDIIDTDWSDLPLDDWGLTSDDSGEEKKTEQLSGIEFQSIYYEPEDDVSIRLADCINTRKMDEKIRLIGASNIPDDGKRILSLLAVRFLEVDFESIANYYAFNATSEEKKIIERLRLVLVDGGLSGFIEDDLLRIAKVTMK